MTGNTHFLKAGAAEVNISPKRSLRLAGYPFVKRNSTGENDPLLSTALYFSDGNSQVIFIGNDILFVSKAIVSKVRKQIAKKTGIAETNILVSATHTHSGPIIVRFAAGGHDKTLEDPNEEYLKQLEEAMIEAACLAVARAEDAKIGIAIADATGIGTNRQDPNGAADLNVPVLVARSSKTNELIALMLICNMHPTVLRENSTVISGDFPGIARQILQKELLITPPPPGEVGRGLNPCPVLHHTGASGDQSPRHVTKSNTLEEAERLGRILANAIADCLDRVESDDDNTITVEQHFVNLIRKNFPSKEEALRKVQETSLQLEQLKRSDATKQSIRLAEVNWFGAVELAHLCDLSQAGLLDAVYENCLPAEIQVIHIGKWTFISWPGEIFIEYALRIRERYKNAFVITLANGELQGYIVTKEAAEHGGYEASNAIFDYRSGDELVATTFIALTN